MNEVRSGTAWTSGGETAAQRQKIHVDLDARSYDILIGPNLLHETGGLIAKIAPQARCVVVTDENVADLHLKTLQAALRKSQYAVDIVLPAGEASKSFAQLEPLCTQLLATGIERGDLVVAFGGGVIGDLAGFAASIVRRGIRYIQIPTTLLAQVDSSVGGKTGINSSLGKNLIGSFHQPALVLADLTLLKTLSQRQFRSGYAEVLKYGLIQNADFFNWLTDHWHALFAGEAGPLSQAIEISCRAKAEIVSRDERESGPRALLNLGHSFGHALEAWAGYSERLLHGEAVAIGMVLAFQFSADLGLCSEDRVTPVIAHLKDVGLPTSIGDMSGPDRPSPETLRGLMAQDKKVMDGKPVLILVKDIGKAFVSRDVPEDRLADFLTKKLSEL